LLTVTVVPAFWQTIPFIALVLVAIISALYLLYRYRVNQLRKVFNLRSHISKDLHDEVASTLSGIRLYSELAKQQLQTKNADQVFRSLDVISENSDEMMQGMSDIVWTINPVNDTLQQLFQKLRTYALQITAAKNIGFTMKVDDRLSDEKLDMQQRRNIYLIGKEAIHNAVKYSGATEIQLDVRKMNADIQMIIQDNGVGFTEKVTIGNGLLNMQLRAKEIGAALKIDSPIQKGTTITVALKT
jgi:signal transduction histidine kinase